MTKEYKGFLDEAIKLGAAPASIKTTITNKETYKVQDNYISVGAELSFEFTLGDRDDVNAIAESLDAYARAFVEHSLKDQKLEKGISATAAPQLKLEEAATVAQTGTTPQFGPPEVETVVPEAKAVSDAPEPIEIAKFRLEKRTKDDLLTLQLYPLLGDGRIGKFADLKMVSSREKLWAIMANAVEPHEYNFTSLPVEYECSWTAYWEHGKEYKGRDGETKRYRDLVRLEAR